MFLESKYFLNNPPHTPPLSHLNREELNLQWKCCQDTVIGEMKCYAERHILTVLIKHALAVEIFQ